MADNDKGILIMNVKSIWLPITSWPELCEKCNYYQENDEYDRECDIQNLCFEIEKMETKKWKTKS